MWAPHKRCNVCALILSGDSELQKRIYNSKYFNLTSGESLMKIQAAYGGQFHYNSLVTHVKKHQTVEDIDRVRRSEERNKMLNNPKCITREQYEAQKKQNAK